MPQSLVERITKRLAYYIYLQSFILKTIIFVLMTEAFQYFFKSIFGFLTVFLIIFTCGLKLQEPEPSLECDCIFKKTTAFYWFNNLPTSLLPHFFFVCSTVKKE